MKFVVELRDKDIEQNSEAQKWNTVFRYWSPITPNCINKAKLF
jgi:hypothetical protein